MADATMTEAQIEKPHHRQGLCRLRGLPGEDSISVVVSAMENGMTDADAARIGEIVGTDRPERRSNQKSSKPNEARSKPLPTTESLGKGGACSPYRGWEAAGGGHSGAPLRKRYAYRRNHPMSSPMKPLLPLAVGLAMGAWLARRTRPQPQESPNRQAQLQQQIRQLKEGYERQDRIRRDFTANVSHELKTPLTSISGYAEILREGMVKSEDVGRFAGKIYEEAQRLIALVEDILNLSHLDEGAPAGAPLRHRPLRPLRPGPDPAGGGRPAAEDHPHPHRRLPAGGRSGEAFGGNPLQSLRQRH